MWVHQDVLQLVTIVIVFCFVFDQVNNLKKEEKKDNIQHLKEKLTKKK